jgi:hypothetical protein
VNSIETISSPEVWRAWKRVCAADLCDADTAAVLRRFGHARFAVYLRRTGCPLPEAREAWHLFESTCQVSGTRAGKRYKDWLFARAQAMEGSWLEAIESGASLLMRSVVREFVRREHAPSFMQSLQQPVGGGTISLEELLPDPSTASTDMDDETLRVMARALAGLLLPTMDKTERALVWAKVHDVSFADPRLINKTRLGRTMLHEQFGLFMARLTVLVRARHPKETNSVTTSLIIFTLMALGEMLPDKLFSGRPRLSLL